MATLSHAIRIRASRAQVFEAITTTAGLRGWYSPTVSGGLGPDQEIAVEAISGEVFRWKLLNLDSDRSVEWECVAGPGLSAGTRVAHRLSDAGDGRTAVQVDHVGWDEQDDSIPTCNTLWGILIGRLRDFVETGRPAPAFP